MLQNSFINSNNFDFVSINVTRSLAIGFSKEGKRLTVYDPRDLVELPIATTFLLVAVVVLFVAAIFAAITWYRRFVADRALRVGGPHTDVEKAAAKPSVASSAFGNHRPDNRGRLSSQGVRSVTFKPPSESDLEQSTISQEQLLNKARLGGFQSDLPYAAEVDNANADGSAQSTGLRALWDGLLSMGTSPVSPASPPAFAPAPTGAAATASNSLRPTGERPVDRARSHSGMDLWAGTATGTDSQASAATGSDVFNIFGNSPPQLPDNTPIRLGQTLTRAEVKSIVLHAHSQTPSDAHQG